MMRFFSYGLLAILLFPGTIMAEEAPTPTAEQALINASTLLDTQYTPSWRGSVFFSSHDLMSISQSLSLGNEKTPAAASAAPMITEWNRIIDALPPLYLNTLLFMSADQWTIRINDTVITPANKGIVQIATALKTGFDIEVEILQVTSSEVTLEWVSSFMPQLLQNSLYRLSKHTHGWSNAEGSIMLNDTQDRLRIRLKPNQGFALQTLVIHEGKPHASSLPTKAGTKPPAQ